MNLECKGICEGCDITSALEQDKHDYAERFPEANLELFDMAGRLISAILAEDDCQGLIIHGARARLSYECGNQFADQARNVLDSLHRPLAHTVMRRSGASS